MDRPEMESGTPLWPTGKDPAQLLHLQLYVHTKRMWMEFLSA